MIVGESVRVDWGMGFTVDGISLIPGAVRGVTVFCCLLPCRRWDKWVNEVVLRSPSAPGSPYGSDPVDGMIAARTGPGFRTIRGAMGARDVSPVSHRGSLVVREHNA
jgi:hypothetical protein